LQPETLNNNNNKKENTHSNSNKMKATRQKRLFLFFLFNSIHLSRCHALANRKSKQRLKGGASPSPHQGFGIVPHYIVDTSPTTKQLFEFLEEEEVEGLDCMDIGFAKTGLRGIFAKESMQKGEYICAIPFVSTILVDETFVEQNGKGDDLLSANKIENAIQFLSITKKERETWQAYLDCLPTTSDSHFDATPDFWSDDEIRQLEVPFLVNDMLSRKAELKKVAQEVDYDYTQLQLAAWLVRSRAFTTLKKAVTLDPNDAEKMTKEGLLQRTVMIPLLDFLNHASLGANAELQVVETKAYEESFYALTATRNIEKGSELRIQYGTGKETSMELLIKYGFLPRDNAQNDHAYLQTAAPVSWSTSLDEDKERLKQFMENEGESTNMSNATQKQILSFRVSIKELLQEMDSYSR
jgi:hypothetical protein